MERNLALIERVVQRVCRRRCIFGHDAEDIRQEVLLKLAADDCAALVEFRGESTLGTFITTVATRVCFDEIRRRRGRWRTSLAARRLGAAAISLERLVYRDGLDFEQAATKLITEGVVRSRDELERVWPKIPQRPVRTFVDADDAPEPTSDDDPVRRVEELEQQKRLRRLQDVVEEILGALPPEDRLILKRLYLDGRTIADVARELGLEQRPLYRRRDRLLAHLRKELEARGLEWDP